jgi:hypothetical protein
MALAMHVHSLRQQGMRTPPLIRQEEASDEEDSAHTVHGMQSVGCTGSKGHNADGQTVAGFSRESCSGVYG